MYEYLKDLSSDELAFFKDPAVLTSLLLAIWGISVSEFVTPPKVLIALVVLKTIDGSHAYRAKNNRWFSR